jgi:hypothetical protein
LKTIVVLFSLVTFSSFGQSLPSNFPVLEESIRRNQLLNTLPGNVSFSLRPILADSLHYLIFSVFAKDQFSISLTPILNTTLVSAMRPYGWGITEESSVMNVPCITLRDNTERAETIHLGTNELIGTNPANVAPALAKLMAGNWKQYQGIRLWDGKTSERIIDTIIKLYS